MPPTLLLADDSITIQRVIELTFADEDVRVVAVGDGQRAIDYIQQDGADIVLADVGMPGRDGYEVAAFVKGTPQYAHIPVLLLTGAFEPVDEARARAVGCDGVLVKPFEPQMVISRVRDFLSGRRKAAVPESTSSAGASAGPAAAPEPSLNAANPEQNISTKEGAPHTETGQVPRPASAAPGAGLEDYFDRLDAALASISVPSAPPALEPVPDSTPKAVTPAPPAPRVRSAEKPAAGAGLRSGDLPGAAPGAGRAIEPVEILPTHPAAAQPPPLGDVPPGHRPAAATSSPSPPGAQTPRATAATPASTGAPGLAEAFAALLAAEQGDAVPMPVLYPERLPDDVIDGIVRRVIARMGDESMRRAVIDAAERLVREEIERIKAGR